MSEHANRTVLWSNKMEWYYDGPENGDPINIDILACRGHGISGLMSETASCGVCSLPDLGYRSPCMGHNFH